MPLVLVMVESSSPVEGCGAISTLILPASLDQVS